MRGKHSKTQSFDSPEEAFNSLPEPLRKEPYPAIYKHMEDVLPFAGEKVFKYAGLQLMSPYAPKLNYAGEEKRISINLILIGNSGSGKTELIKKIQKIGPYNKNELIQKQTGKALQQLVSQNQEGIQLLVNDMKTIMGDSELLKTYETVIADGMVKRDTATDSIAEEDVRAAMVGGAVPDDISNQIYGGLIFRVIPIEISYTPQQQGEIFDHITEKVSNKSSTGITTDDISDFYDIVYDTIHNNFTKGDIPKIAGYEFEKEYRDRIKKGCKIAIGELNNLNDNVNLFRQLWDGFRLSALHGLINVHNREIVNQRVNDDGDKVGDIQLEEKDAVVGTTCMQRELDTLNGFLKDDKVRSQLEELDAFKTTGNFGLSSI